MKKDKKPRPCCPNCDSTNAYYRKWTNSFLCRTCGYVFKWNAVTMRGRQYKLINRE